MFLYVMHMSELQQNYLNKQTWMAPYYSMKMLLLCPSGSWCMIPSNMELFKAVLMRKFCCECCTYCESHAE